MMKINYTYLPIKTHFFFFWATMGAILPFLPVYGKQLGISPLIMGSINTILPIIYMIVKPIFGFILDYFHTQKKLIFMIILAMTSSFYILLYFLPSLAEPIVSDQLQNVSCASLSFCDIDNSSASLDNTRNIICQWICKDTNFSTRHSLHTAEREPIISPNTTCLLNINDMQLCQAGAIKIYNCNVTCNNFEDNNLYTSINFWGFVILLSFGNIGFSVSTCISDAICCAILGENAKMKYGRQRLWSGIGLGLAALLSGYAMDLWSQGKIYKIYTPAFLFVFVFCCIDLICCRKLQLPKISTSTNIFADVYALLKFKYVIIFSCFAIIVGAFDGYLIYFLLWYEEDLAMRTGYMDNIKLIEGLTAATECFGTQIIFMFFSGKILQKLGYGYTFTLALISYAIRLGLFSIAPTPWWIVSIEFLMLGPAYGLSHATTIAFANAISSSDISVSVQGIMGGIKDGFGMAIGNFIGSILLNNFGGAITLKIFSIFAAFCALVFFLLYITYLKHKIPEAQNKIEWKTPDDAQEHCVVAE